MGSSSSISFIAGLDLGQSQDPTALVLIQVVERIITAAVAPRIERVERAPAIPPMVRRLGLPMPQGLPTVVEEHIVGGYQREETVTEYHVRHLERFELGTSYTAIVARVVRLLDLPPLRDNTVLVLDRTGVGRPVTDMFEEARGLRAPVVPVTITAGERVTRDEDGSHGYHVPKKTLAATLEVLGQARPPRLQFVAGLPLGDIVKAELRNFQYQISATGHLSVEAGPADGGLSWRGEGAHDDCVLSVALAVWYGEHIGAGIRMRWFE